MAHKVEAVVVRRSHAQKRLANHCVRKESEPRKGNVDRHHRVIPERAATALDRAATTGEPRRFDRWEVTLAAAKREGSLVNVRTIACKTRSKKKSHRTEPTRGVKNRAGIRPPNGARVRVLVPRQARGCAPRGRHHVDLPRKT